MSFKGQYKDFQISFQVNTSNVLELQALNPKINELYAFAIDKDYLVEHSQFFNIIEEPSQLFQVLKNNFAQVKFEGGQLTVPYGTEPRVVQISILLFRDPSFQTSAQNKARIIVLQDLLNKALKEIEQLRKDLDNLNLQQKQQWTGYYVQNGTQYPMTFSQFCITPVPNGQISGSGSDTVGQFTLVGVVGADSVTANFEKRYVGKHIVFYFGKIIQNTIIEGTWSMTNNPANSQNNRFRIAPISRC